MSPCKGHLLQNSLQAQQLLSLLWILLLRHWKLYHFERLSIQQQLQRPQFEPIELRRQIRVLANHMLLLE